MGQKVNIRIGGRSYPLVVKEDEEEILRNAAKKLEKYVSDFEKNYNIYDKQDALAMGALQLASELENLIKKNKEEKENVRSKLKKINNFLDNK